jgi:uncharacterized cupredoxin-like copper-binding protein
MSPMRPRTLLAPLALAIVLLAACGDGATSTKDAAPDRTVDIDMRDIAYSPDHVSVRAGETIRFVFHNQGKVSHDALIGDAAAQSDHEEEMSGDMGAMHGNGDAVTVEPGKTGALTHTFEAGDKTLIGCHEPGHYAAGMQVAVQVE